MHTKAVGETVMRAVRKSRRATKEALKRGKEPDPKHSVEYTD